MNRFEIAQGKVHHVEVCFRIRCESTEDFGRILKEAAERVAQCNCSGGFSTGYTGPNGQQIQTVSCIMRILPQDGT